ncbi:pilus assembly PilX family protein [Pulveribacter suum]|uniref:Pilus assembly protein PilX n=1 Tax=Pulveribacter suum TaxID=2116657 RepID=A0A2P1NJX0_9BURK|nr:PilX N-terminal domain-containing pilus assembly protein [Pulveribacter suum]AVP57321.1 pilus assembly protein PilX [Pulveribacter suum]
MILAARLPQHPARRPRQRGVALFVVIVFVMLSMLLALWASRTSFFNEMVVGNDTDYQRAFEAAQALLQDAELDIRGEKADGSLCMGTGDTCRTTTSAKIPLETKDIGLLLGTLNSETSKCRDGLCVKRTGRQDFWNYTSTTSPAPSNLQPGEVPMEQLTVNGVAARYGQYTGAGTSDTNPILNNTVAKQGGWYWVEVMPYVEDASKSGLIANAAANQLALHMSPNVVYRITAIAKGRKPNTQVVLQQAYARQKLKD